MFTIFCFIMGLIFLISFIILNSIPTGNYSENYNCIKGREPKKFSEKKVKNQRFKRKVNYNEIVEILNNSSNYLYISYMNSFLCHSSISLDITEYLCYPCNCPYPSLREWAIYQENYFMISNYLSSLEDGLREVVLESLISPFRRILNEMPKSEDKELSYEIFCNYRDKVIANEHKKTA